MLRARQRAEIIREKEAVHVKEVENREKLRLDE